MTNGYSWPAKIVASPFKTLLELGPNNIHNSARFLYVSSSKIILNHVNDKFYMFKSVLNCFGWFFMELFPFQHQGTRVINYLFNWELFGYGTVPGRALTLESCTGMCHGHDPLLSGPSALSSLPIYRQCAAHVMCPPPHFQVLENNVFSALF